MKTYLVVKDYLISEVWRNVCFSTQLAPSDVCSTWLWHQLRENLNLILILFLFQLDCLLLLHQANIEIHGDQNLSFVLCSFNTACQPVTMSHVCSQRYKNTKDHGAPDLLIRIQFLTRISVSSNSTSVMGKIILHVEGKNLPRMDLLSKSDPYLCVFIGKKKVFIATD